MKITFKVLELINKEYKIAKVAFFILTYVVKPFKLYDSNYCLLL